MQLDPIKYNRGMIAGFRTVVGSEGMGGNVFCIFFINFILYAYIYIYIYIYNTVTC